MTTNPNAAFCVTPNRLQLSASWAARQSSIRAMTFRRGSARNSGESCSRRATPQSFSCIARRAGSYSSAMEMVVAASKMARKLTPNFSLRSTSLVYPASGIRSVICFTYLTVVKTSVE